VDCELFYQPAQSSNTNICYLSFFPAIQSLYYKDPGICNLKDIFAALKKSFKEYNPDNLNKSFLFLFMSYNMILECKGDNHSKQSHIGRTTLEKRMSTDNNSGF
jgi:hypothetical protein